ncbi:TadE-like protein [Friedmanniella luteola]|uniref:TadE-like protein n=1 Tax=Friedmanniella luteola TaxID=546871 RepID=A0A1H1WZE0_9ACTN|nr:TadE family protein [Friedmanniella luteola]SDT01776.1 TadE-like protein [Friedmanniella luteola]
MNPHSNLQVLRRPARRRRWRLQVERGSAAIETVLIVPAFLLFVLLIIYAGRVAVTRQAVQAAAAEAARSASLARNPGQAQSAGAGGAASSLHNQHLSCRSQQVRVDASGFAAPVGTPAKVTATVICAVDLSNLTLPGLPGTRTITATMTSPIDTYRERG